ncbi:MAG: hypothetical protein AB7F35_18600 [Acetobacteraceae bacterium]
MVENQTISETTENPLILPFNPEVDVREKPHFRGVYAQCLGRYHCGAGGALLALAQTVNAGPFRTDGGPAFACPGCESGVGGRQVSTYGSDMAAISMGYLAVIASVQDCVPPRIRTWRCGTCAARGNAISGAAM